MDGEYVHSSKRMSSFLSSLSKDDLCRTDLIQNPLAVQDIQDQCCRSKSKRKIGKILIGFPRNEARVMHNQIENKNNGVSKSFNLRLKLFNKNLYYLYLFF